MKLNKASLAALIILGCSLSAALVPTAHADEPCNMTLCMWGKVTGAPSDGCSGEIRNFFNKQVTKKGSFLPNHTADAREKLLEGECPASMVPSQFIGQIIQKFGRIKRG